MLTGGPVAGPSGLSEWTAGDPVLMLSPESRPVGSVATPAQARALLDAVRAQGPRGAHLVAFYACIYYAAMRPEEVSMLSAEQCELPPEGWGRLMLAGARPQVGSAWTDDGKPYEERQLKHRARRAVRPVPIPPVLVAILRAHLEAFGTTTGGQLFSAVRGGPVRSQEYGAAWKEARKKALTAAQVASPLVSIPYDLCHACVSFWLRSGVSLAETARRAGQSIAVLQRYYAKVLDGEEARMNELIDQGLAEQEDEAEETWILAAGWPHVLVRGGIPPIQGETACTQKGSRSGEWHPF
ncbi:hypothetical protein [Streptomyces sp. NPDC127084]|uniref:hypothetical protein n=1 Tax=Streptomyces sp. NPDC127084 TaxID=3347133 RepID=UPI0036570F51